MIKKVCFLSTCFLALGFAEGFAADVLIKDFKVTGNERLEKETIVSYLPFEKGTTIHESTLNQALKDLYKTGFFSDVKVDYQKNGTVLIQVKERPIISSISFVGNDKLKEETLSAELQNKVRDVYMPTKIKEDVNRLKTIYQRSGLYSAEVKSRVENKTRNRVDVIFEIEEGPKNYIDNISFTGNEEFSASSLRDVLISREKRWYRFFSSTDTYDPDRLNYDKEMLRRFYLNHGYIDFEILDTKVVPNEEEHTFDITFDVKEGKRYKLGKIDVQTNLKNTKAEVLKEKLEIKTGQYYNASQVEESIQILTDELGRDGYAFVDIYPDIQRDEEKGVADLTFKVKEGARVFINRINIGGNSRTLDKVIRREFRLSEADPFNTDKLRRSRQRIENLGYFDKVDVKTVPVENAPDKTDVNVTVSEKSTGSFNVGIGWSTYDGLLLEAGIQERNFLGTGKIVGISASTSGRENQIDFSFTNPYFMDRPLSAGFDLFHVVRDYTDDSSYKWVTTGGALRMGWDYVESVQQTVRYTLQQDNVTDIEDDASIYVKEQQGRNILSMIGTVLSYDKRDSAYNPTEGYYTSVGMDVAGIGGDNHFVRFNLNATQYYELIDKFVLSVGGTAGYVVPYKGEDVRINNRYFLGGATLRGFEIGGVGARDKVSDDSLGGDWRVTASTQLMFPLGFPTELGIRGKLFVDAGIIGKPSGKNYDWSQIDYSSKPRVSVGTGILWQSPMGPINVDFGFPIVKEKFDKKEIFRLNFGTGF